MRILLCTGDGGGNVPALATVVRELIGRGHTVRALTGPYYPGQPSSEYLRTQLSGAGCEVVSREPAAWQDGTGAVGDVSAISPDYQMLVSMALWMPMSVPWAVEAAKEIESFRPAVLLTDLITPAAAIGAEAARVPCVMLQTSVPVHRLLPGLPVPGRGAPIGEDEPARQDEFLKIANDIALPWLNAARARFGLDPDSDPWAWEDRAARVLVLSSEAFDFHARVYPPNYVYTGTLRPPQTTDGWENPWDGTRPLVVVSTTTTGLAAMWFAVFLASANALVSLDMRGLFTVGPLDPSSLVQDDRLAYRPFVPHSAVLPEASAMVTQCGHGATMAGLRYGVPLVCVPVFADQHDIAARVVHHGAGIRLSTMSTAEEFRDAIENVVGDKRYRDAARVLAEKLTTEDGAHRAADEIESVVGSA